jgi:hypothetical protein
MNIAAINTTVTTLAGTQLRIHHNMSHAWALLPGGQRALINSEAGGNEGGCARTLQYGLAWMDDCMEKPVLGHTVDRVLLW